MTDTDPGLIVTWEGPVLRLRLNRPKVGNALSQASIKTIIDTFDEATRSNDVRVVALTAEGQNFCTGIDLVEANQPHEKSSRPRTGHLQRRTTLGANRLVRALIDFPLPVVAGVRGWAAGIGNTLALSSDYIVASETAKFWAPFVGRGFTPDSGSTYLLPRVLGPARAKKMILLAEPLPAAEAERWGAIHEVVPDEELEEKVEAAVAKFARAATVSVGLAKSMLNRSLESTLEQALTREALTLETSLRSADFKEGIAALRERREPDYTGR